MLRRRSNWWLLALVCAAALSAESARAQAPRPIFPFGLNERYYGYRPRVYGYWPSAYVYPRYGYTRGTGYDLYHFPPPPPGSGFPNQPYGAPPDWMRAGIPTDAECLDGMPIETAPTSSTEAGSTTVGEVLEYPAP
jgi:hypothetical protein